MAAVIEMTIERPFQHRADQRACDKRQRQACEERPAGSIDQHRADIAARHGKRPMSQIDKVHQPKRHRQAAGQHEQQHAIGDAVEQDSEQRGHRVSASLTRHSEAARSAEPGIFRNNVEIPGSRA